MFEISDIILGALSKGAANGYQIRRRINNDFAHFQSVSAGSLYPALRKLKARGAITESGSANGSLDSRHFEITTLGYDILRQRVQEAGAGERLRSDFLAAVYFSETAGPEETERLLEERAGVLNQKSAHSWPYPCKTCPIPSASQCATHWRCVVPGWNSSGTKVVPLLPPSI